VSYESVGQLIDRWVVDKEFRKAVRRNAEMAVRETGVPLTPAEWDAIKRVDWTVKDEELQSRISKYFV
jgi:hypothetical protein